MNSCTVDEQVVFQGPHAAPLFVACEDHICFGDREDDVLGRRLFGTRDSRHKYRNLRGDHPMDSRHDAERSGDSQDFFGRPL